MNWVGNPLDSQLKLGDLRDYMKAKCRSKHTAQFEPFISEDKINSIENMSVSQLKFFYQTELRGMEEIDQYVLRIKEGEIRD